MVDDNSGDDTGQNGVERRTILGAIAGGGLIGGIRSVVPGRSPRPNRLEWTFETGDDVWRGPAVEDGTVFFGSQDGNLYAVDAETGEETWHYDTGDAVFSSPAVADGTVYLGVRGGGLVAVDAATGEVAWKHDPDGHSVSSPTVADGTVYAGNTAGNLDAVDTATGDVKWTYETDGDIVGAPTVDGGTVYAGNRNDSVAAVDAATGEERWRVDTDGTVLSPAVDGGTVFAASLEGTLYALDGETGEEAWTFTADGRLFTAVAAGGTVYAGSDGVLYALDAGDGSESWTASTRGKVRNYPAVVEDVVYVGGGDTVYALNDASGEEVWSYRAERTVDNSSPALADGTLFIGCEDNQLYAIRTGEGGEPTGEPADITGFHPPQVDGMLYGHVGESLPDGKAGEWADGHAKSVELVGADADSSLQARLFTKGIGDELYLGIHVPAEERARIESLSSGQLSAIRLYLGRSGTGEIASGDVRLVGRPIEVDDGEGTATGIEGIRWTVQEYANGEFATVGVDGPLAASAMASDHSDGGFGVETRVDTGQLDEVLDGSSDGDFEYSLDLLFGDHAWGLGFEPLDPPPAYEMGRVSPGARPIPVDDTGVGDMELIQTVQDANGTLPLVKHKDTLARVFVDNPTPNPITVDVRLICSAKVNGSWTKLGEVTKTGFKAPPNPTDRANYDDSANFELPGYWRAHEQVSLYARVHRQGHLEVNPDGYFVRTSLFDTHEPKIWLTRVDESATSGVSSDRAERVAVSAFRRAMPFSFFNLVRFDPTTGLKNVAQSDPLRKRLSDVATSLRVAGKTDMDQFFGLTQTYGGGLSDPPWGGGPGNAYVAWGDDVENGTMATSWEQIMAHEIDHNIGGKNWSKHLGSPCGSDPDDKAYSSWRTGELGWSSAYDRIIPANHPELMGYCNSLRSSYSGPNQPRKWVSGYRWKHLVDRFRSWKPGNPKHSDFSIASPRPGSTTVVGAATADATDTDGADEDPRFAGNSTDDPAADGRSEETSADGRAAALGTVVGDQPDGRPGATSDTASTARVVSGFLYPDGSGELEPSFEMPGRADGVVSDAQNPQALLRIDYGNRTAEIGIDASFEPIEEEDVTRSSFTLSVPDGGRIGAIRLVDAETEETLDAYEATGFEIREATVETPGTFERNREYQLDVTVDAQAEAPLYRQLLYSPGGEDWYPVSLQFTDDSLPVVFGYNPGGEDARFMLQVSDGVRTERVETETFVVPPRPPEVQVTRAHRWVADAEANGRLSDVETGDDGGDAAEEGTVSGIRNAAGPVETVAGATTSLQGRGTTGRGTDLGDADLTWEITDESGASIEVVGSGSGKRMLHRFARPGTYTVAVTGADPATDLTTTDDIDVVVDHPSLPRADVVDAFEGDPTSTETSPETPTETPTATAPGETTSTDGSPAADGESDGTAESTPGLGIASALGALGTAGYLLKQRFTDNDDQE